MLRIRLSRVGKKKAPSYRMVVADARAPRDGAYVEIVGHYNPRTQPKTLVIDADKVRDWLSKGAQPSERVDKLLAQQGLRPAKVWPDAKPKAQAQPAAAPRAAAPAAPAAAPPPAPAAEPPAAEPEAVAPVDQEAVEAADAALPNVPNVPSDPDAEQAPVDVKQPNEPGGESDKA